MIGSMAQSRQLVLENAERLRGALRRGELRKPRYCTACHRDGRVVAHREPGADALDVTWLCHRCAKHWSEIKAGRPPPGAFDDRPRNIGQRRPEPIYLDFPEGFSLLEQAVLGGRKHRGPTKQGYLVSVRQFTAFAGDDPARWTGAAVEAWRDNLAQRMTPRSVNVRLGGLRYASRRLEALGLGDDFASGAESLSAPYQRTRKAIPFEAADTIVATCEGDDPVSLRDRAILVLGFRTGLRREGIVNLTFEDVGPGRKLRVVLKGGRYHEIEAVDDETLWALGEWMEWLREVGIDRGPIFRALRLGRKGWRASKRGLDARSVNLIVGKRARQAVVAGVSPHIMRHSFISWAIANGVSDRRIMAVTGHTDPKQLSTYHTDIEAVTDPVGSHLPPFRRR